MEASNTRRNCKSLTIADLAEAKELPADFLRKVGLRNLSDGVGIPYFSRDGAEIAVKRRTAMKAKDGSFWPKGKKLATYGDWHLDAAQKARMLNVVEGESDCWALWFHQLPALGIPGANAGKVLTAEHVECLDALYIHREPDHGGKSFVDGILARLRELQFVGKVFELRMPEGIKDPADLHIKDEEHFLENFETCIRASVLLSNPDDHVSGNGRQGTAGSAPRPEVQIFTAAELANMELPEPTWAVPGIIPEGLSFLAGKPKLGKSWLALNLALAVATGGVALGLVHVASGEVLYLALEDTKRRLKDRIGKLEGRQEIREWPATLYFAQSWPRQDKGGLAALLEWLGDHPAARLVIIDTWPRFRPIRPGKDHYEEDYSHAAELKAVADSCKVPILSLAHCRKLEATDPLDEVSGTNGFTAAADGILVMKRERGQHDATIFLTGRDIDEREIALRWEAQYALWSILGEAAEYRLSKQRKEVLDVLGKAGKPLTPTEAAPLLGKKVETVKSLFWNMANDNQLTVSDGKYTCANPANCANPTDQPTVGAVGAVGAREQEDGPYRERY
jgi:hypothetical protein